MDSAVRGLHRGRVEDHGHGELQAVYQPELLDKQSMEGDEQPYVSPEAFRSATCTLLYLSKRMPEIQSTMRWLCKRLVNPTCRLDGSW